MIRYIFLNKIILGGKKMVIKNVDKIVQDYNSTWKNSITRDSVTQILLNFAIKYLNEL